MTTRMEIRSRIRIELNDQGGTPLWSDAALNQWLDEALRDYGERLPREVSTSFTSVAGQAEYTLPSDFDRALRVEHPAGVLRIASRPAGGDVLGSPSSLLGEMRSGLVSGFDIWAGQLVLEPAPEQTGETIRLRYLATYPAPTTDGATLATPARDDALLVWFVCGRALQWLGTDESKRQRFERQRGVSAQQAATQYERDLRTAYTQRLRRVRAQRLALR